MNIKVVGTIDDTELFENKIKEYIEKGYEIKASNIAIYPKKITNEIYFYALLQKND